MTRLTKVQHQHPIFSSSHCGTHWYLNCPSLSHLYFGAARPDSAAFFWESFYIGRPRLSDVHLPPCVSAVSSPIVAVAKLPEQKTSVSDVVLISTGRRQSLSSVPWLHVPHAMAALSARFGHGLRRSASGVCVQIQVHPDMAEAESGLGRAKIDVLSTVLPCFVLVVVLELRRHPDYERTGDGAEAFKRYSISLMCPKVMSRTSLVLLETSPNPVPSLSPIR